MRNQLDLSVFNYLSEAKHCTQAQQGNFKFISGTLNEERKAKLIHDMKEYCELDTLTALEIVGRLVEE